ncbi:caspase family protein [Streptomyces sp. NPDC050508]|uniref:caspase, EACC1-associated type n=1 Tax=Streptomyces sp. NPDC050508 TaxID=3155405 RepID=UPI0034134820
MTDAGLLRDYSRSRAVLIGASEYDHLPSAPAAANSLKRMEGLLRNPLLCGWPKQRVEVLREPQRRDGLPDQLMKAFEGVEDVALFYFVGHGQLYEDELCLALRESPKSGARCTTVGLPFSDVRAALRACDAQTKIVILDCCFSGVVTWPEHSLATTSTDVIDRTLGTGAITMAASGAYRTAGFEPGPHAVKPQTYFTKYLIDVIEQGLPGYPDGLPLGAIYARAADALADDHRPEPTRSVRHDADRFILARNRAEPVAPPAALPGARSAVPSPALDPEREQLIDRAVRIACSLNDGTGRDSILTESAEIVAAANPGRAEEIVSYIDDLEYRDLVLVSLALVSPGRAEEIIQRERIPIERAWVMLELAKGLIDRDPGHAQRLVDQAELLLAQISSDSRAPTLPLQTITLSVRARLLISADLPQATKLIERVLQIPLDPEHLDEQTSVLIDLATSVVVVSAQYAGRLIDRVEYFLREDDSAPDQRAMRMATTASTVARIDPDRATRLMSSAETAARKHATTPYYLSQVPTRLAQIAKAGRSADPQCAERLVDLAEQTALNISEQKERNRALRLLAEEVAKVDPHRAGRITQTVWTLGPRQVEELARITDPVRRVKTLVWMAHEAAATNPGQARRWLDDAYRTVLDTKQWRTRIRLEFKYRPLSWRSELMATVAREAAAVDSELAARAAQYVVDEVHMNENASVLADCASEIAAADPEQAALLVDRAEAQTSTSSVFGLDRIGKALLRIAPEFAESDLARFERMVLRAQSAFYGVSPENRAATSGSHWNEFATTLAANSPDAAEEIADKLHGESRDEMLRAILPAFTETDPGRAERIASAITDDLRRNMALRELASSIVEQARGMVDENST